LKNKQNNLKFRQRLNSDHYFLRVATPYFPLKRWMLFPPAAINAAVGE